MEGITYETVWTGDLWRQGPQPVLASTIPQPRLIVTRGCKPCKSCGAVKRMSQFPRHKHTCKDCVRVYYKAYKQRRNEDRMPLILEAEGAA